MMVVDEAGSEVIEAMRHVLQPGEEDERWPGSAPVEHLESDFRSH